jgi:putative ABC transport system permease protein
VSWMRRVANVFRSERLDREIDEELRAHLDEAHEAGRDETEARHALGSPLKLRDETHDARVVVWLDSLRADATYGWRRLAHNKITTAAAILSLGLAIGACTAAFRLTDALLWRPLPVAAPHELYVVTSSAIGYDGKPQTSEYLPYRLIERFRDASGADAEVMPISFVAHERIKFSGSAAEENVRLQYATGAMFASFGLKPAVGRLLDARDDRAPNEHPNTPPYAVISYDYWKRRFSSDPNVVGRMFQFEDRAYEVIGVMDGPFTGTEPGKMVDIFVPMAMNPYVDEMLQVSSEFFVRVKPGTNLEQLRAKLQAASDGYFLDLMNSTTGTPEPYKQSLLNQHIGLEAAPAGYSRFQSEKRRPLAALGVLSLLVLLIACVNVANLMSAQSAARARELALRVSIGGGRRRLVQLVLVECAWIGIAAAALGAAFAWWAAPRVVAMINPRENPVRLALPADWRVLAYLAGVTFLVTLLFGLAPALRAAKVDPASALKGGEDPHARRKLMSALIAAQVAICVFVVFTAGMFVMTLARLTHRPLGFSADRLLTISVESRDGRPAQTWLNAADELARQPGVQSAALSDLVLLSHSEYITTVTLKGQKPSQTFARFLSVSPSWWHTMNLPIVAGRNFTANDVPPRAVIVNEAFASTYFAGSNPVGQTIEAIDGTSKQIDTTIVGVAKNACYSTLRQCAIPVEYLPFQDNPDADADARYHRSATFLIKTDAQNPLALGNSLREELSRIAPELRVTKIRTQQEIIDAQTIHERLLSTLATFFAVVALLLAGIGLYGVLNYSVVRRRREIGIRIAVGAQPANIARTVIATAFAMVIGGVAAGLAAGAFAVRPLQALFYEVKPTDASALALPAALILGAAVLAALPAVIRAMKIDPVILLRAE